MSRHEDLRALAYVDLAAIEHNVRVMREIVSPAKLIAVVKANGYGHGAIEVSAAALRAGAIGLGVATADEGVALRNAAIASRILLMSEPRPHEFLKCVQYRLEPALYTREGVVAAAQAAGQLGACLVSHVKVDTGMHRVGVDPQALPGFVKLVESYRSLIVGSIWTHLAWAEKPSTMYTGHQLERFSSAIRNVRFAGYEPAWLHAANSAAALTCEPARLDVVRVGIAIYGISPSPDLDSLSAVKELRPALSLRSVVAMVKVVRAGEKIGYGLKFHVHRDTVIATIPIGYGDGVPRALGERGGAVLLRGQFRPIAGSVSMDQLMIDCGPPGGDIPRMGEEVVLLGEQGGHYITPADWAAVAGTIAYEVVTGLRSRIVRRFVSRPHVTRPPE